MKNVDCVIKRNVYPLKIHSCSKNIRRISFFSCSKIDHCMDIPLVERKDCSPNDNFLDWSKGYADNKINVTKKLKFVGRNNCGKRRKCW